MASAQGSARSRQTPPVVVWNRAQHRGQAVRRELRRGGEPESLDAARVNLPWRRSGCRSDLARGGNFIVANSCGMPASYREPLVLFYREEKSVDAGCATTRSQPGHGQAAIISWPGDVARGNSSFGRIDTVTRTRPTELRSRSACWSRCRWRPLRLRARRSRRGRRRKASASAAGKGFFAKLGLGALTGPFIGLIFAYLE